MITLVLYHKRMASARVLWDFQRKNKGKKGERIKGKERIFDQKPTAGSVLRRKKNGQNGNCSVRLSY
jgi:hypothetical protein